MGLKKAENLWKNHNDFDMILVTENHEIFMSEADCPDHTCIKTGKLYNYPIVCLPNKLVIEFAENNETDAEVR